jgi:hypothetical protein
MAKSQFITSPKSAGSFTRVCVTNGGSKYSNVHAIMCMMASLKVWILGLILMAVGYKYKVLNLTGKHNSTGNRYIRFF